MKPLLAPVIAALLCQPFAAMPVVKLLVALDLLARDNDVGPDSATQQELRRMLASSDDQIAGRLWTAGGGGAIVARVAARLGLTGTQPPEDPGQWGDTQITPAFMLTVYRYIAEQLPTPDREPLRMVSISTSESRTGCRTPAGRSSRAGEPVDPTR